MYDPKAGKLEKGVRLWRELGRLEREGHQPRWQALWDIARLRACNRISPAYYLETGLYRKGIHWRDKLEYMSPSRQKECLCTINPTRYHYVVENKILTHGVLTSFGILTPPFYGIVGNVDGVTWDGKPLRSETDLLRLLQRLGVGEVCFKQVSGTRGEGFFRVEVLTDGSSASVSIHPRGEEVPLPQFWKKIVGSKRFDGYFCQGVVNQHPDVAQFCPASLNTVRSWMAQREDGSLSMRAAMLRIGLGDTSVDNVAAGNIGAAIDITSGRLSSACLQRPPRPVFSRHPTTGVQIEGRTLPVWREALALCQRTAELFPYFTLLATDVAFSTDGPMIMELGATPDDCQSFFDMGVRSLLEGLLARHRRKRDAKW